MSFHVGQRIECIDARDTGPRPLALGAVYTVAAVGPCNATGRDGVWLNEEPCNAGQSEVGWYSYRFRPVDETRLEIFRQMLNPVPKRESIDA